MKIKDFLNSGNWIKGHMARDRHGRPVGTTDPEACHFDVLGAFNLCYPDRDEYKAAMERLVSYLPTGNKLVCMWNDSMTWDQIEETLRKADV